MRDVNPIIRWRYATWVALIGAGIAFLGGFALSWGHLHLYWYFVGAIYAAVIFSGLGAIIGYRIAPFVDRLPAPPTQDPIIIPRDVEAIARERFNAPSGGRGSRAARWGEAAGRSEGRMTESAG